MKAVLLLPLLVVAGAADDLVPASVPPLKLKVPSAWTHSVNEGTHHYSAPSGEAYFDLDVGATAAAMDAGTCRDKIVKTVGGDGWEKVSLGGQPAARRVFFDQSEDKTQKFQSQLYVGCNGKTTFSLLFNMVAKKKDRFAQVAEAVAKSIQFAQGR